LVDADVFAKDAVEGELLGGDTIGVTFGLKTEPKMLCGGPKISFNMVDLPFLSTGGLAGDRDSIFPKTGLNVNFDSISLWGVAAMAVNGVRTLDIISSKIFSTFAWDWAMPALLELEMSRDSTFNLGNVRWDWCPLVLLLLLLLLPENSCVPDEDRPDEDELEWWLVPPLKVLDADGFSGGGPFMGIIPLPRKSLLELELGFNGCPG
jgi:hypothetical protein